MQLLRTAQKCWLLSFQVQILLFSCRCVVFALFEDEVGLFDSKIETTGHGPTRYVGIGTAKSGAGSKSGDHNGNNVIVITSDSGPAGFSPSISAIDDTAEKSLYFSSCYIAARDSDTGKLLWRRNVCTSGSIRGSCKRNGIKKYHLTLAAPTQNRVFTLDTVSGSLKCWDSESGSLIWENLIMVGNNKNKSSRTLQQLWIPIKEGSYIVAEVASDDPKAKFAFDIDTGIQVTKSFAKAPNNEIIGTNILGYATVASCNVYNSSTGSTSISIEVASHGRNVSVFVLDSQNNKVSEIGSAVLETEDHTLVDSDKIISVHITKCSDRDSKVHVWVTTQKGATGSIIFDIIVSDIGTTVEHSVQWIVEEALGEIESALLLSDSFGAGKTLATTDTTAPGSPVSTPYELLNLNYRLRLQYESLVSFIMQPLFMIQKSSELNAATSRGYDHNFGLSKIAVALTPYKVIAVSTTAKQQGNDRDVVRYQVDLPYDFVDSTSSSSTSVDTWRHQIIHGSTSSIYGTHGINGGAHSREVLVLSRRRHYVGTGTRYNEEVQYICFDGTSGAVYARGHVDLAATSIRATKILQILPIAVGGMSMDVSNCRQDALLVLDDNSVLSVLDPSSTSELIGKYSTVMQNHQQSSSSPPSHQPRHYHTGLYAHILDRHKSQLSSLWIRPRLSSNSNKNNTSQAYVIGSSSFSGESIVHVAFPNREEVVQSTSNVLGDESLLLKYLNPHLMVVVTVRQLGEEHEQVSLREQQDRLVANVLARNSDAASNTKKKGTKRKPLGVTTEAANVVEGNKAASTMDSSNSDVPNLFINVMDTVSGRVVYRVSHVNAYVPSTTCIPINVLLSENWIYYTFVNQRTRRTEIGVLSMYEGMIDPKGLTAFTSYETFSSKTFSSFDSRESKPVVLAKTYTIPKSITALSITSSRGGISNRRLLIATSDGQIHSIDRKSVEPRRPVGPLKDSEKKEGLVQYNELLPTVSYMTISYNQSIEAVSSIISAPTDLESQSIVMAYGGPDIYFARVSPSRGFDLLPDSFNKPLLTLTVVALTSIVIVLQRMASKKIVKHCWS